MGSVSVSILRKFVSLHLVSKEKEPSSVHQPQGDHLTADLEVVDASSGPRYLVTVAV